LHLDLYDYIILNEQVYFLFCYRSALAALHRNRRNPQHDGQINCRQAEKLWLQALAKDDVYIPAYLSLASLYLYRFRDADKALAILQQAKDKSLYLSKLEPLFVDARALKAGGNQHMLQAGSQLFMEQEYLAPPSARYGTYT